MKIIIYFNNLLFNDNKYKKILKRNYLNYVNKIECN